MDFFKTLVFHLILILLVVRVNLQGITIPVVPLESLVLDSMENWRRVILKGSSPNGIPILDPFVVPFDIPLRVPGPVAGYYELVLSKLTFAGLSTFRVKSLTVDPTSRDMSFENYIGNMSAKTDYSLKYYFAPFLPPAPISDGSAYGGIYGADLKGSGNVFPTPGSWFKILRFVMSFSFEDLEVRIYPKVPLLDYSLQKSIMETIYDGIQKMKPNISQLTSTSYSKTVELRLR